MEILVNNQDRNFEKQQAKYKALVLGSTGAIGRELIIELCKSYKWDEITVIVRRELETWSKIDGKEKLKIIKVQSLDDLEDTQKWQFFQYNSVFCCIGGRTKEGEKQFKLTDYTYPLWSAQIAKKNDINHFSLLTSQGSNSKSMFLYMRVKGQIEEAVEIIQFPFYSIFRPALLVNRDNDQRCCENFLSCCPIPKIDSKILAKSIRIEAELIHQQIQKINQNQNSQKNIYENNQIPKLIDRENY